MKFILIFSLAYLAMSIGNKTEKAVIFQSESQSNINYFGNSFSNTTRLENEIEELDHEVGELKEFEMETTGQLELLQAIISKSIILFSNRYALL